MYVPSQGSDFFPNGLDDQRQSVRADVRPRQDEDVLRRAMLGQFF